MKVIVALDLTTVAEAIEWAKEIDAEWYKVGKSLIYEVNFISLMATLKGMNKKVFFDAKLYDIPNTVKNAVKSIEWNYEPDFLTVACNPDAAISVSKHPERIAYVPSLSSETSAPRVDNFSPWTRAKTIVCRPGLAALYRAHCPQIQIICPGVRLPGEPADDHHYDTAIPKEANYIVVGRPIIEAKDPRKAYENWLQAAEEAVNG